MRGSLQPLAAPAGAVDLLDQASIDRLYQAPLPDWTSFLLQPGQLVLCQVADPLRLGPQLGGWIATLSHAARLGLMSPWDAEILTCTVSCRFA